MSMLQPMRNLLLPYGFFPKTFQGESSRIVATPFPKFYFLSFSCAFHGTEIHTIRFKA